MVVFLTGCMRVCGHAIACEYQKLVSSGEEEIDTCIDHVSKSVFILACVNRRCYTIPLSLRTIGPSLAS